MTDRQKSQRAREAAEHRHFVRRILASYDAASAEERKAGIGWYARANREANRIARTYGIPRRSAAGIIAALSPRQTWSQNVKSAEAIARAATNGDACPAVALGDARAKAWRIAQGEEPGLVLGRPKVRAFYANITGELSAVTVDVWAARAAYGRTDAPVPSGRLYDRLARAYRAAAEHRAIAPRDLQAAVWVHIRGAAY